MATIANRLIFLVIVFMFISMIGFGSALRIIVEPQSITKITENNLNVTCIADGPAYWAQTVMTIQILKQGQDKAIATIDMKQKLTMGVDSDDNMKAEGHVDKNASKSFLTLVIQNPTMENAGTYRCQVFFFDENLQIKAENVFGNVTFDDPDITVTVTNLMDKVSDLIKTVQKQEDANLKQKDRIDMLEKQLVTFKDDQSKCERNFDILRDEVKRQNKTIERLNVMADRQNQQIGELKDDHVRYEHFTILLNKTDMIQNKTIAVLKDCINEQHNKTTEEEHQGTACLDGWAHYQDDQTCIKVFRNKYTSYRNWTLARKACGEFGGDLVQIRDEKKNMFVYNVAVFDDAFPWIGVWRNGGDFKYPDGSPLDTYHPWRQGGYPLGGEDNCVYMFTHLAHQGQWGNQGCSRSQPYVCSTPSYRTGVF